MEVLNPLNINPNQKKEMFEEHEMTNLILDIYTPVNEPRFDLLIILLPPFCALTLG